MFRVEWSRSVELVIFELWALAEPALQARISAAINELERRLSLNPLNEGESRLDNIRITFQRPLGIEFSVDSATMIVTVLRAWLCG
jgi:hypothetical protein